MSFPILLDFIVVALLIATILYAVSLNRKLMALYQNREELQKFIENFSLSLSKAEISMNKLRLSGEKVFSDLSNKLKDGGVLRDDLTYLLERGEKLASTLEEKVQEARAMEKSLTDSRRAPTSQPPRPTASGLGASSQEHAPEESDLIQSLRNIR